jgi:hypothetical protein
MDLGKKKNAESFVDPLVNADNIKVKTDYEHVFPFVVKFISDALAETNNAQALTNMPTTFGLFLERDFVAANWTHLTPQQLALYLSKHSNWTNFGEDARSAAMKHYTDLLAKDDANLKSIGINFFRGFTAQGFATVVETGLFSESKTANAPSGPAAAHAPSVFEALEPGHMAYLNLDAKSGNNFLIPDNVLRTVELKTFRFATERGAYENKVVADALNEGFSKYGTTVAEYPVIMCFYDGDGKLHCIDLGRKVRLSDQAVARLECAATSKADKSFDLDGNPGDIEIRELRGNTPPRHAGGWFSRDKAGLQCNAPSLLPVFGMDGKTFDSLLNFEGTTPASEVVFAYSPAQKGNNNAAYGEEGVEKWVTENLKDLGDALRKKVRKGCDEDIVGKTKEVAVANLKTFVTKFGKTVDAGIANLCGAAPGITVEMLKEAFTKETGADRIEKIASDIDKACKDLLWLSCKDGKKDIYVPANVLITEIEKQLTESKIKTGATNRWQVLFAVEINNGLNAAEALKKNGATEEFAQGKLGNLAPAFSFDALNTGIYAEHRPISKKRSVTGAPTLAEAKYILNKTATRPDARAFWRLIVNFLAQEQYAEQSLNSDTLTIKLDAGIPTHPSRDVFEILEMAIPTIKFSNSIKLYKSDHRFTADDYKTTTERYECSTTECTGLKYYSLVQGNAVFLVPDNAEAPQALDVQATPRPIKWFHEQYTQYSENPKDTDAVKEHKKKAAEAFIALEGNLWKWLTELLFRLALDIAKNPKKRTMTPEEKNKKLLPFLKYVAAFGYPEIAKLIRANVPDLADASDLNDALLNKLYKVDLSAFSFEKSFPYMKESTVESTAAVSAKGSSRAELNAFVKDGTLPGKGYGALTFDACWLRAARIWRNSELGSYNGLWKAEATNMLRNVFLWRVHENLQRSGANIEQKESDIGLKLDMNSLPILKQTFRRLTEDWDRSFMTVQDEDITTNKGGFREFRNALTSWVPDKTTLATRFEELHGSGDAAAKMTFFNAWGALLYWQCSPESFPKMPSETTFWDDLKPLVDAALKSARASGVLRPRTTGGSPSVSAPATPTGGTSQTAAISARNAGMAVRFLEYLQGLTSTMRTASEDCSSFRNLFATIESGTKDKPGEDYDAWSILRYVCEKLLKFDTTVGPQKFSKHRDNSATAGKLPLLGAVDTSPFIIVQPYVNFTTIPRAGSPRNDIERWLGDILINLESVISLHLNDQYNGVPEGDVLALGMMLAELAEDGTVFGLPVSTTGQWPNMKLERFGYDSDAIRKLFGILYLQKDRDKLLASARLRAGGAAAQAPTTPAPAHAAPPAPPPGPSAPAIFDAAKVNSTDFFGFVDGGEIGEVKADNDLRTQIDGKSYTLYRLETSGASSSCGFRALDTRRSVKANNGDDLSRQYLIEQVLAVLDNPRHEKYARIVELLRPEVLDTVAGLKLEKGEDPSIPEAIRTKLKHIATMVDTDKVHSAGHTVITAIGPLLNRLRAVKLIRGELREDELGQLSEPDSLIAYFNSKPKTDSVWADTYDYTPAGSDRQLSKTEPVQALLDNLARASAAYRQKLTETVTLDLCKHYVQCYGSGTTTALLTPDHGHTGLIHAIACCLGVPRVIVVNRTEGANGKMAKGATMMDWKNPGPLPVGAPLRTLVIAKGTGHYERCVVIPD